MKFAFYKAKGTFLDGLVRWWMKGPYAHVEAILGENEDGTYTIASSKPGIGVRIAYNQELPDSEWDIVETRIDSAPVALWFIQRVGMPYDYFGLLGFVFGPFVRESTKRYFCSEACLAAAGLNNAWRYDPNSMYDVLCYF
jgi:uncharacterized protein YycO